jgi:glycosyltransferase involved in cell wall biosynthesis
MRKVAIILMKGFDGCGVSRFAIEMQKELRRTNNVCDVFSLNKKYERTKAHNDKDVIFYKKFSELDFSQYDTVILNSYPKKFDDETYEAFKNIKATKVGMMHEIIKMNYGRIDQLWKWIDACDIISSFSDTMDFTQDLKKRIPNKKYFSYRMFMSEEEMNKLYNDSLTKTKIPRLVYFGRWTTMKDPRRLFAIKQIAPELEEMFIGLELSTGCAFDIKMHSLCQPMLKKSFIDSLNDFKFEDHNPNLVQMYPPINRDVAFEFLSLSMFGASFYRLKEKLYHNLGNRMEYTQIELSCLCLPIFDISWALNTFDRESGVSYNDIGNMGIISDPNNLENTVKEIRFLIDNPEEYKKRRENAFNFVKKNYCATENIPFFFDNVDKLMSNN